MKDALKEHRVALAVAAAVAVVFSFAPPARFLQWDDAANLLGHDRWRGLSWENLRWMATTRHYGPWQPLSWLSWAVDHALWGLDAAAFRRTNVVLHACTAALLVLAVRRAVPRAGLFGALAAGLFFGLHPLRVESVIWITERRDVLSGLFSVLSVLLWLDQKRRWSLAFFLAAVLSKGTAVAVLPFILAVDLRSWRKLWPHAVVAVFAAVMNLRGFSTGDLAVPDISVLDRILVSLWGLSFYAAKTAFPSSLSPYYPLPSPLNPLIPGAVLAVLLTALCWHKNIRAWAAPVWFSYAAALAPVSGLLQNGRQAAADRYSYLACLPFAVLAGAGFGRLRERRPRAASALLAILSLALAAATVRQSGFWRDDAALWARAAEFAPDSYLIRSNLAQALFAKGETRAAATEYRAAIALEPRDAEARLNLAAIVEDEGDAAGAEALLREAISLKPAWAPPRFNLGILLLKRGRKDDGLAQLREAVRLNPALAERFK